MSKYKCCYLKTITGSLIILFSVAFVQYYPEDINAVEENIEDISGNERIKRYDLRIILMVYDRARSLLRLLKSLNDAEYDNDSIKLEVWIDRSVGGNVDNFTLNTAGNFIFKHGEYEVLIHPHHVGIYGQWITTWKPDVNSSEIAVILEDDLTLSKYFWRYLKIVHNKYDNRADINGYSLQGCSKTFKGRNIRTPFRGPSDSFVFLFPVLGTWGFSPSTKNWKNFLEWLETIDKMKLRPSIPGNIASWWYKSLSRQGRGDTMWEIWHIYFAWKHNEYTLYSNFPDHSGLAASWTEKGLHFKRSRGPSNSLIQEWKKEYENLTDSVPYIDLEGKVIHY